MTFRTIVALLAVVAIAACGGAATEEEVEVVQESPLDDAAAVAAMIDEYVLHYNMGHASMAVDYGTDGILLGADGSVLRTAEGRLAGAEAAMEFNPELAITTGGVVVLGEESADDACKKGCQVRVALQVCLWRVCFLLWYCLVLH